MQTSKIKMTGILLAGGKSKRMGREKGTLKIGHTLLYQYPLRILENLCDEILISTCREPLLTASHRMVCDEVEGIGPLGGIYSCLKQSSSELNLVLSYDMPLVNEALFRLLLSRKEGYELVLPAMKGNPPEPLCGVYNRGVAGAIAQMIEEHDFQVNHLLKKCRSRIVPVSEDLECWHPDLFLNINSEKDLSHIPPGLGNSGNEGRA